MRLRRNWKYTDGWDPADVRKLHKEAKHHPDDEEAYGPNDLDPLTWERIHHQEMKRRARRFVRGNDDKRNVCCGCICHVCSSGHNLDSNPGHTAECLADASARFSLLRQRW